MKYAFPILAISLLISMDAASAADPAKTGAKPASPHAMDHGKSDASHGPMEHRQATGAKGSDAFVKLDANKDGKLSRAEMAKDPKAAHFGMLDANRDGSLSAAEYAKARGM